MTSDASAPLRRPLPLWLVVLCGLAFHGPLLLMKLPATSFDANFHMSMAQHYAHHWFDPWNEKSLAGFSQTTYPPLTHQWIAVFSHIVGLDYGFMIVLGAAILLLPVAVYRFSRLWVDERAASYAALCCLFLGALEQTAYQDGQIGTISATTLFLLAIPFAYQYVLSGSKSNLLMGLALFWTASAAHHATLLFGLAFFLFPTIWLVLRDYRTANPESSRGTPIKRIFAFGGLSVLGMGLVLLPYLLTLIKDPIEQKPIPHLSRANFLLEPKWGLHYWIIPVGVIALALPYIFYKGRERRLQPLLLGFYFALLFGLGGTTPVPRWVMGRAFEIMTFERFTYWALLLAMPFVGLLGVYLIDRYGKRVAVALVVAVVGWGSFAVAWNTYFKLVGTPVNVAPVIDFLNQPGHNQYRYLTLGFGNGLSKIACYSDAPTVDGEYNSGRTLPEMIQYGSAQLSSSKYYGTQGMLALSAMLHHAPRYGLRYIFVADRFYEPILTFAGWRQIDSYDHGNISVWTNPDIPFAHPIPSPMRPPRWQGYMWGIVPFGVSLLAIILAFRRVRQPSQVNASEPENIATPVDLTDDQVPTGGVAHWTASPATPDPHCRQPLSETN